MKSFPAKRPGPVKTFKELQGIELLGGSAGYQQHVLNNSVPKTKSISKPRDLTVAPPVPCEVTLGAGLLYGWATVQTVDGHCTKLQGWGNGTDVGEVSGVITFTSWEDMMNGPLDFVVVFGELIIGGPLITFSRNGDWMGEITATVEDIGEVAFEGACVWRQELELNKVVVNEPQADL